MPTVAELLAALPAEDETARSESTSELAPLFPPLSQRPIPPGRFRRLCALGGLSTKLTSAYLAYWIRSWYRPVASREKDLLETNLRGAIHTLETMEYLRGAIAKMGQLLTSFPASIPSGFVDTLSSLHFQSPPMHFSLVREQLLSELGDPSDLFAEFDEHAVAAASIGQVHRATLRSGVAVAVKIQYPGIARAIRADLRTLKSFMTPLRFSGSWKALELIFDELRRGLELEADYENEAQNIKDVRRLFVDDDRFEVPNVYESLSSRRILTMDYLAGQTVDEFLAENPSQSTRDAFGAAIMRATCRTYSHRILHSDTHPGNFLFMPDGRLGIIDLGNLRRFNDVEWRFLQAATLARTGSDEEVEAFCKRSLQMTDEDARKHAGMLELVIEMFHVYNQPYKHEGEFDFGDEDYLRRLSDLLARSTKQRWMKQEPVNVFLHRLNFQLPALLYKLKSKVNVHQIMEDEIGPDGHLS